MGLFNKKKKTVFDPREQYVPEVVYNEDLTTTLVKTIGIGSKDAKKVEVDYENDTLTYYFDSGILRGIESKNTSLELYQRFYWVEKENYKDETLEQIAQLAEDNSLIDFYQILNESYPDYVELMNPILYSLSLQLLLKFYNEKINAVRLDLFDHPEDRKVRSLLIMDIDSRHIGTEVQKELEKQENFVKLITGSEIDVTVLKVLDDNYDPVGDLEKIVWAAAESESSLENIFQLSKGFIWSQILRTINDLGYSQKIEILDPSRIVEESDPLPDLDLFLTETEDKEDSVFEEVEETIESNDSLPDVEDDGNDALSDDPFAEPEEWSYSPPVQDEHKDDDGGFVYEESSDDEISLTKHLLDDFDFNVKLALAEEEFDRDLIVEISSLLRKNRELEEKTSQLELKISPLQTNYDNRFTSFQHASVSKTIDDENVVGDEIEQMRELSNRSFRELYDLEEERFDIGVERKDILKDLERKLVDLSNENSQELIYHLNQKKNAIDNVVNLAYHTPNDDDEMEIDPSFLAAVDVVPENTPMFQQLMKKYGDPFKTLTK